ncbi:SGNH hydrolase-type esterase domain-containing protein, partial [Dysosmobacter welbionis]
GHPVAALCSLPVQIGCLGRVLRHAVAELPADAQVALGTGIALLRRRLIPADSLLPVLFYTLSGLIQISQVALGGRVLPLRRLSVQPGCLRGVPLHAFAPLVAHAQVAHGRRGTGIHRPAIPVDRL